MKLGRQTHVRKRLMLWEWQVLVGHLNFYRVVALGRAYTLRICSCFQGVNNTHCEIRAIKADLYQWLEVFTGFIGVSFWCKTVLLETSLQFSSGISGKVGFGSS